MTKHSEIAALGFSVHTGWANVVAVSGPLKQPTLLRRGRVDIAPGREGVAVFHAAAEMAASAARSHVDKCTKACARTARTAIATTLDGMGETVEIVAAGVVASNAKLPQSLDAILRSHMLIHSAEGDFYRRAIVEASKSLDLKTTLLPAKELADAATEALSLKPGTLPDHLAAFGRRFGRPWGRDEKDAFCAACVALARAQ